MDLTMSAILESLKAFFVRIAEFLPDFFGALIVLIVGWVIASVLKKVLIQVLKPWLDQVAERILVAEILRKGEIGLTLSELCGTILYWIVMIATLVTVFNALGLTEPADLLERVLAYVPNVIAGIIMLGLGLFFGSLVGGLVQTASANAGITQAKGLGQVARVVVIVFATVIALEKFFKSVVVETTFIIIVAAVSFGLALAFGLGCKDLVGKMVADFIANLKRR
ncbi:MAG: hypothetical protein NC819_02545 [Candidatus Omnitrophica bacterium]|nr:hypothetical protein [Candidatus Omnitrophota bacterium]